MRKSQCCGTAIWRIGARRRRCSSCGKKWSVWIAKRGRPVRKNLGRLVEQVFVDGRSLAQLARSQGKSRQALSYRFRQAVKQQLKKGRLPNAPAKHGRLILVADGLWFRFNKRPWVLYQMALRPVESDTAVFVDPLLLRGRESKAGWEMALNTIPAKQRGQICAFVVDNFSGSSGIAKENGWLLQLCIYHVIAEFKSRLGSRRPTYVRDSPLRLEAFQLVQRATKMPNGRELGTIIARLSQLAKEPNVHRKYIDMLREFVRNIDKYRAYRLHPELRLPRTTGSLESAGARMRKLMRRIHGFSSPRSLRDWSTVHFRTRPAITCRPAE